MNTALVNPVASPLPRFVDVQENGLGNKRKKENSCGVMEAAHFADMQDALKQRVVPPSFKHCRVIFSPLNVIAPVVSNGSCVAHSPALGFDEHAGVNIKAEHAALEMGESRCKLL